MTNIISISATDNASQVFNEFKKNLPDRSSFSGSLAVAAKEYMHNHKHDFTKISQFIGEEILVPTLYSDILIWKKYLRSLSDEDKIKLYKRLNQLTTLMKSEKLWKKLS